VFNSFWLGRTRRKKIEGICNAYLAKGYSIQAIVPKKSRRLFIIPMWVTLLIFEIDADKMSDVNISSIGG
jgi:hypothetical protein